MKFSLSLFLTNFNILNYFLADKPKFVSDLKTASCTVGETVVLECQVSKENETIKWYRKGKLIKPGKRLRYEIDGKIHRLIINEANMADECEYTAKLGTETTKGAVTVQGKIII